MYCTISVSHSEGKEETPAWASDLIHRDLYFSSVSEGTSIGFCPQDIRHYQNYTNMTQSVPPDDI